MVGEAKILAGRRLMCRIILPHDLQFPPARWHRVGRAWVPRRDPSRLGSPSPLALGCRARTHDLPNRKFSSRHMGRRAKQSQFPAGRINANWRHQKGLGGKDASHASAKTKPFSRTEIASSAFSLLAMTGIGEEPLTRRRLADSGGPIVQNKANFRVLRMILTPVQKMGYEEKRSREIVQKQSQFPPQACCAPEGGMEAGLCATGVQVTRLLDTDTPAFPRGLLTNGLEMQ